jgi:hypothetical protein
MKKFLLSTAFFVAPAVAMAGDGGNLDSAGALLIQAVGRAVGKLFGMF